MTSEKVDKSILTCSHGIKYYTETTDLLEWALSEGNKSLIKILAEEGVNLSVENLSHPIIEEMILEEDKGILLSIIKGIKKTGRGSSIFPPYFYHFIGRNEFENMNYILKNTNVVFSCMTESLFIKCLEKSEITTFTLLFEKTSQFMPGSLSTLTKAAIILGYEDLVTMIFTKAKLEELNAKSYTYFMEKKEDELTSEKPNENTSGKSADK
jgi:hypothetical protein